MTSDDRILHPPSPLIQERKNEGEDEGNYSGNGTSHEVQLLSNNLLA